MGVNGITAHAIIEGRKEGAKEIAQRSCHWEGMIRLTAVHAFAYATAP